jgi:hypothetical protein
MKCKIFWVITSYHWERGKRFAGTYRLHLQVKIVSKARYLKKQAVNQKAVVLSTPENPKSKTYQFSSFRTSKTRDNCSSCFIVTERERR